MAEQLRKEQTYGWYPSVRDIYLSKNQPIPYRKNCFLIFVPILVLGWQFYLCIYLVVDYNGCGFVIVIY